MNGLYACDRHHTHSPFRRVLTLLFGAALLGALLWGASATVYARYVSRGTATVGFAPTSKPTVLVTEVLPTSEVLTTSEVSSTSEGARAFTVTCSPAEGSAIRVRLFNQIDGAESTPQPLQVICRHADGRDTVYTLQPSRTADNTAWVYRFTDGTGQEIRFDTAEQPLQFEIISETQQPLVIRAEAVKK